MEALLRQLSANGYKITPQRRLILEMLRENRHASAEDICAVLKQKEPNISLGTVYRNLALLMRLSIVTAVDFRDGRLRYELNDSHHHHLICMRCGKLVEFPGCDLKNILGDAAEKVNFRVIDHSLEVFGYCGECCGCRP